MTSVISGYLESWMFSIKFFWINKNNSEKVSKYSLWEVDRKELPTK